MVEFGRLLFWLFCESSIFCDYSMFHKVDQCFFNVFLCVFKMCVQNIAGKLDPFVVQIQNAET